MAARLPFAPFETIAAERKKMIEAAKKP